ncbi:MAG: hypothetical protein LC632_01045 [Xanthomonadaceae bacterium]|nr:hypothetical protein [Xanthomonadaceae bacterium]
MQHDANVRDGRPNHWAAIPGLPANAFVANEARWLAADAGFVVFVLPGLLAGAKVSGQMILGHTLGFFSPKNPLAFVRADLVLAALVTDLMSDAFLSLDPKNFRLTSGDVIRICGSSRRSLWTVGVRNSGKLRVVQRRGRDRTLILLGQQDLTQIGRLLTSAGFVFEADGST